MAGLWSFTPGYGYSQAETASVRHGDPNDAAVRNVLVCTTRETPSQLLKQIQFEHDPADRESVLAARRRAPGPAAAGEVEIVVDGQPRVFQHWDGGDRWQAACQLDEDYAIVLDVYRFDPGEVTLARVHDFEACLVDRRNWIRAYYDEN